ncbi:hypothetical protein CERZMDRAFT_102153 [Cercospora zeae-maydis SCOH1-5]|uniref:BTB domain-containing protein n=1 Tax=Cercospora zeae-maydis SCOH1-5 TaxID=717836 RepID=A0A6A6F138_9PEZI|nr:hypothetical protein CERZMDRAFT_102153 [Cercospora zeae-maydis SCOH1-5]
MALMSKEFTKGLATAQNFDEHLRDFTISCGDRKWRVHKIVLGFHGGPLRAAVHGEWVEAKSGKLDLSADPLVAVDAMVQYLYTFGYELPKSEPSTDLTDHTQVCILADKYKFRELQSLAARKFAAALRIVRASQR